VEGVACAGHEVAGEVSLLDELILAMRIRALVSPSAEPIHLPVPTHLGLLLLLVLRLLVVMLAFFNVDRIGSRAGVRKNFVRVGSRGELYFGAVVVLEGGDGDTQSGRWDEILEGGKSGLEGGGALHVLVIVGCETHSVHVHGHHCWVY